MNTTTKLSRAQIKVVDLVTAGARHESDMPAKYRRTVKALIVAEILRRTTAGWLELT